MENMNNFFFVKLTYLMFMSFFVVFLPGLFKIFWPAVSFPCHCCRCWNLRATQRTLGYFLFHFLAIPNNNILWSVQQKENGGGEIILFSTNIKKNICIFTIEMHFYDFLGLSPPKVARPALCTPIQTPRIDLRIYVILWFLNIYFIREIALFDKIFLDAWVDLIYIFDKGNVRAYKLMHNVNVRT